MMHNTGGGNQFVGRIADGIQLRGLFTNGQIQRPDMYPCKYLVKVGRTEINRNSSQLGKFGHLPQQIADMLQGSEATACDLEVFYDPSTANLKSKAEFFAGEISGREDIARHLSPLPFMLPIIAAQPDSAGITRATAFPFFVTTIPSGIGDDQDEKDTVP